MSHKPPPRRPEPGPNDEAPAPAKEDKDEGGISVFWRVFGGTLLSIAAMLGVTAYQQLAGQLGALRADLEHLHAQTRKDLARVGEDRANLVRKDECDARLRSARDGIEALKRDKKELRRLQQHGEALRAASRADEAQRRELADGLRALREQEAGAAERRALLAEVRRLEERAAHFRGRSPGPGVATAGSSD